MIQVNQWAHSALGAPIALHASRPLEELRGERPILLMGGVHGDEPEGIYLAERTLELLRTSPATVPWVLVTCLNPDGAARGTRVNGRGVDLNRNYPSKSWSPKFEKDRYHPGPSPGSEPEVAAVCALMTELTPRLVIHCHSWKPMVVCAGEPGMIQAEMLARSSGYEVKPEIGYPTPGSLSQYGWFDNGIPIICIEEVSGTELSGIWPRFEAGMRAVFGCEPAL